MRATTFANFNLSVTTMSTELVRDPRSSFSRWHGFLRLYPLALHRCQPQYPITASWFRSFPKRRSGQPSLSTSAPGPCPVALCSSDSGLRRLDQQFARRVGLRTEAQGTQLSTQGTQLSIRCGRRWGAYLAIWEWASRLTSPIWVPFKTGTSLFPGGTRHTSKCLTD